MVDLNGKSEGLPDLDQSEGKSAGLPALPVPLQKSVNRSVDVDERTLYAGPAGEGGKTEWLRMIGKKLGSDSRVLFQCFYCSKADSVPRVIVDHMTQTHKELKLRLGKTGDSGKVGGAVFLACRHCDYVTVQRLCMWDHMKTVHCVKNILPKCDTYTADPQSLNTFDPKTKFHCPQKNCDYEVYQQGLIVEHILSSHKSSQFIQPGFVQVKRVKLNAAGNGDDVYVCTHCRFVAFIPLLIQSHCEDMHACKHLVAKCELCEAQFLPCLPPRLTEHYSAAHSNSKVRVSVTVVDSQGTQDPAFNSIRKTNGEVKKEKTEDEPIIIEVKTPEVIKSKAKKPEVKEPKVKTPKEPKARKTNGVAKKEKTQDEPIIIEDDTPEKKEPKVKRSDVKKPEVKEPKVKEPEVKKPEVKTTTMEEPKVKRSKTPDVKKPEVEKAKVIKLEVKQEVSVLGCGKKRAVVMLEPLSVDDLHQSQAKRGKLSASSPLNRHIPPAKRIKQETGSPRNSPVKSSPKPVKSNYKLVVKGSPKSVKSSPKPVKGSPKPVKSSAKLVKSSTKLIKISPKLIKISPKLIKSSPKTSPKPTRSSPKAVQSSKTLVKISAKPVKTGKTPVRSSKIQVQASKAVKKAVLTKNKSDKQCVVLLSRLPKANQIKTEVQKGKKAVVMVEKLDVNHLRSDKPGSSPVKSGKKPVQTGKTRPVQNGRKPTGKKLMLKSILKKPKKPAAAKYKGIILGTITTVTSKPKKASLSHSEKYNQMKLKNLTVNMGMRLKLDNKQVPNGKSKMAAVNGSGVKRARKV